MPATLLLTKLHRPRTAPQQVLRRQLIACLHQSLGGRGNLAIIVAPAGFGKTTLVSQWAEELSRAHNPQTGVNQASSQPVAWLTLDEYDNDLISFLHYLVAAVQNLWPHACTDSLRLLQAPQLPPLHYLAATLLQDLTALDAPFTLVLDDYHTITLEAIHQLLTRVIEYLPPTMHLVLVSRTDPPLPLARWRMQRSVVELRGTDLAFSMLETELFLTQAIGKPPTPELLHTLHQQVEGWVAGLQLAALSLRTEPDESAFVRALAGNNCYIVEYLLNEVFARQPVTVQNFLLRTSLLDRFCAALATALWTEADPGVPVAVTLPDPNQEGSQAMLSYLVAANLFIAPLDDQGEWYRYHQLFRDLLRRHLHTRCKAAELAEIHCRASVWLADHGLIEEAIQHALAGRNERYAVQLIAQHRHDLLNREEWRTLDRWLALLPEALVQQQAVLLLTKAWICTLQFKLAAIPPLLQAAAPLLHDPTLAAIDVQLLQAEIDAFWSQHWYWQNEGRRSLAAAQQALECLPTTYIYARGGVLLYLGQAAQMIGEPAGALRTLSTVLEAELTYPSSFTARILLAMTFMHYFAGELTLMQQTAQSLLQMATQGNLALSIAWAHCLLGIVAYEWNELETATRHFTAVFESRYTAHSLAVHNAGLRLAWIEQVQGRPHQAQQQVAKLLSFHHERGTLAFLPLVHSFQIHLALQQGDMATALCWAGAAHFAPLRGPLVHLEIPLLTHAKILLAQGTTTSLAAALANLVQLRGVAEFTHNTLRLIEILAVQALVEAAQKQTELALATLHCAVLLAKAGRCLRTFVDLGLPLARLLYQLVARGIETEYLGQVLAAFPAPISPATTDQALGRPTHNHFIEPLTERELEVLALLAQRLSNQEIAQALGISPLTVRTHASNLYQKFGVNTRKQAVTRAQTLGLLAAG